MWPWEHAIVAYLAYSLCCHIAFRKSPTGLEAFAVVFASVLPDLIDKPLAWEFGVFDSGYAIGHSIFFAVPLAILIGTIAHAATRPGVGLAFGLGYLSHPPADIIDSVFRQGALQVELMLWPITPVEGRPPGPGLLEGFFYFFDRYWSAVLTGDLSTYLLFQFGLAGVVLVVWLADGAPVLRESLHAGLRVARAFLSRVFGLSRSNQPDRR
ncbi:metal-dependent hydrolase [Natrinema hispanicum]|uniref:LexA-binding, inner membrane-associated putative hydrolase n=1 Tax=Natrinema hispanicum TaxID=392421 RepID=A0A1I0HHG8_9EURY|nr:metal-dependent hydrolase [Natrinema hispanicum]SDC62486.1 LexA-binding, inner membrane-associated putative hydrolase [Natrinema hispanicum]SET82518.1 LexA-binding, inner membrane-associated putative hydrolase [Natrinema hispanicum]